MATIVVGEEPYSRDPAVSEWRNPSRSAGQSVVKQFSHCGSNWSHGTHEANWVYGAETDSDGWGTIRTETSK